MTTIIVHCYIQKIVRFLQSVSPTVWNESGFLCWKILRRGRPGILPWHAAQLRCSGRFFDCTASNIPPSLSPPRSFSLSSFCSVGQSSLRTPTFMFPVVSSLPREGSIHCFSGIFVVESSFRYATVRSRCIRNPLSHRSLKLQYAASADHAEDVTGWLSEFTHV